MIELCHLLHAFDVLSPSTEPSLILKGELLAVISAFCWAASASVYKKGLEGIDAWSGNLVRTGCAAVGFLFLMIINNTLSQSLSDVNPSILFWLIFSAFFAFFLGDSLFFIALKDIGVSRTAPLSSTYPLFVVLWSVIIFKRPVSIYVVGGTFLIILAIKLISKEEGNTTARDPHKGVVMAISAAVFWSVSIVILDHLVLFLPSEAVAGFRFVITFLLITALVSKRGFTFNRRSLVWIGVGGMVILVCGNYTFLEAIRLAGSANVAPISSMYPVISVFFAALFLREKLTLRIIGGTLFSFLGVMTIILSSSA